MTNWRIFVVAVPLTLAACGLAWIYLRSPAQPPSLAVNSPARLNGTLASDVVTIPSGSSFIGYPRGPRDCSETPFVQFRAFQIERCEVTNAQFAQFVEATNYRTDAERRGNSLVFDPQGPGFRKVSGATWNAPTGPGSTILGKENHPVVHVTYYDAVAYANWKGRTLPTEFEWEYAARSGVAHPLLPIANDVDRAGNTWQGNFPLLDLGEDGHRSISAIAHYPASPSGLFDITGNVAEWTSSWYAEDSYQRLTARDPQGPLSGTEKVTRGGSWISSDQTGVSEAYYWYRSRLQPDMSNNFTGFRCVKPL